MVLINRQGGAYYLQLISTTSGSGLIPTSLHHTKLNMLGTCTAHFIILILLRIIAGHTKAHVIGSNEGRFPG